MVFKNTEDLKNYILMRSQGAIVKAQEQIYAIINRFLKEYYAEFSPSLYERTYQLFQSLVKTDIVSTGNGWIAEVYFDLDALDYSIKRLHGVNVPNKGWSEEKTLGAAMHGSHGGYTSGTAVWDESLNVLNAEAINILKRMLISEGIPIK